jgi:hypothetical protein
MSLPSARSAPGWDSGDTLADRFRAHAGDTEHLYGYAMRGMADDWEAGGPTRLVCRGYEAAPHGAVIQLRLLAGVFRLVLTGRTPELGPYYPCLGGTDPASQAWPVMREVIAAHIAEMHEALTVAPQTNEVGRAAALLAGLSCRTHRLAEVSMEFGLTGPRHAKPEIRTRLWNPDAAHSPRHRLLGTVHEHGIPVTLARAGQPEGDLPWYVA